jgi:hypothetical protein
VPRTSAATNRFMRVLVTGWRGDKERRERSDGVRIQCTLGSAWMNSYVCLPPDVSIVMFPVNPVSPSVPE